MRCVCSGAGRRRTRASDGAQRSDWRSDWLSGRGMIREREAGAAWGGSAARVGGWMGGWMATLAVWLSGLCLAVPLVSPGGRAKERTRWGCWCCLQSISPPRAPPTPAQRILGQRTAPTPAAMPPSPRRPPWPNSHGTYIPGPPPRYILHARRLFTRRPAAAQHTSLVTLSLTHRPRHALLCSKLVWTSRLEGVTCVELAYIVSCPMSHRLARRIGQRQAVMRSFTHSCP